VDAHSIGKLVAVIFLSGSDLNALLGIAAVSGLIVGGCILGKVLEQREKDKRIREAHEFSPSNIHGDAGQASKNDAKKGGWI
jgi:hypothetical protein